MIQHTGIDLSKRYGLVLADAPWRFETWNNNDENSKVPYETMSLEELIALKQELSLDFICAEDCNLVMWATFPLLPQALILMREWGFKYVSGGAWAKSTKHGKWSFGYGHIYRSASEVWLLGSRGTPNYRSMSVRNLIVSERRQHSRKPPEMYRDIERLFDGPYLELFARNRRPGWDSWGREVDKFGDQQ